jgi:hypothetical protein
MSGPRFLPLVLALSCVTAHAQVTTPHPFLASVSPPAVQVGTTVEVTVNGTDLDGASRLHFSVPGITCAPKLDDKQKPVANKFLVTVPKVAAATALDLRVVAQYGISNPRGFVITALPVVPMPANATNKDAAFKGSLNTVIVGTAVKQATSFISIDAKKDQGLVAVCQPLALDSRMDASVALRNADGAKVARLQPDGLLDFTPPADGVYTLEVSDLMFRGDAESPFMLTLTTGPVVQYAFDGGAQCVLYGRNLPKGAPVASQGRASLQRVQVSADEAKHLLASNPVKAVRFGAENETTGAKPAPVALKLPTRYNGWFATNGQARVFTFEAKKGEVFWIEVNSSGKGLAADPFFIVEKNETFIAEANDRVAVATKTEFDAGFADPSYRFEAKEDGTYRVKLRNLFSSATQEPFELTVQPAGGDYDLVAIPSALPKGKATTMEVNAAPLWRGGVAVMKVFALRRGGFNGAIELAADALPADVKFLGGSIREGQSVGHASFFAEETAKDWAGAVKLHGKSGGAARGATALFKVANTAKESTLTRLTDEVAMGVVASDAPVTVEAAGAMFETDGKGKLSIPLQVKRRGDCNDEIKLASIGIDGLTVDIAAKATSGKLEVDVAKLKLPAGDHSFLLQGTVKFKHKRSEDPKAAAKDLVFLVHSKPVVIRVKPPEKKP